MPAVTVDELGRIQLPRAVQRQLGLAGTTPLNLEVKDGKIILTPIAEQPKVYYEGNLLVVESEESEDILNMVDIHREERIQEQFSW